MNDQKLYITTTLPYANGYPHIGHLFEIVLADIIARSKRKRGYKVFFNTGLDEHGKKIIRAAGKEPLEEYQNYIQSNWSSALSSWNISNNSFYKTSSEDHKEQVLKFWKKLEQDGFLTLKKYEGLYCSGCESFKKSSDLVDDKCPDHPNLDLEKVSEENYFFSFADVKDEVKNFVEHKLDLKPTSLKKELLNIIDNTDELSVSRKHDDNSNLIVSPNPDQDIYVWLDALLNYIFSIGYYNDTDKFFDYWVDGEVIQICGPDNLKFQGAIWQSILRTQKIPFIDRLLVHGTIKDKDGKKISKTLGNYIHPQNEIQKYGIDAVRYYIAAGLPTYKNACWDSNDIKKLYNTHLVNGFGNLSRRVTTLIEKYDLQRILAFDDDDFSQNISDDIKKDIGALYTEALNAYDNFEINKATESIHNIVDYGNRYFTEKEPWSKDLDDKQRSQVLVDVWYIVVLAVHLYSPIIPSATGYIRLELDLWKQQLEDDVDFKPSPSKWFEPK